MANTYHDNLVRAVLAASVAEDWESAVQEWVVFDCEEDESSSGACICGKERLHYLFTIRNAENGRTLYPIGSSCIRRFARQELDEDAAVYVQKHRLLQAVEAGEFITLSPQYFSRKLLGELYREGTFPASRYNDFDGRNDYRFLLDMFNKKHKESITPGQQRKIRALMLSIRWHLRETLKFRRR